MKITIVGAAGRMGGALIRAIKLNNDITLAAALEHDKHPALGSDAGLSAGIAPLGLEITANPEAAFAACDTAIDFTMHSATQATIKNALAAKTALVLGTTGLNEEETAAVKDAAELIPIVWAPNMSLGVNLLLHLVKEAAAALNTEYDVEITEIHHRHKLDSPSGTALALGRAVAEGRNQNLEKLARHGREGIVGERPRGEIGFHAMRGGDVVGDHTVLFAADGERVELTHKAGSRDCFAQGALHAARWLMGREPGLYGMADVLGFKNEDK